MKRVFFALKLEDSTKIELRKLQERVRPLTLKGKYISPSLFHLTLQFLGEVEEEEVLRLNELHFHWLNQFDSLELIINHLGCFHKKNRWILWAGVKNNPMLDQLADLLQTTMGQRGFGNDQPFRPHITLAREVQFNNKEAQSEVEGQIITETPFTVDGFHLMESTRLEGRMYYNSLKKFSFCG